MGTVLQQSIMEEACKDVQGIPLTLAYRYFKRYGGELDELNAMALYWMVEAVHSYDAAKSNLTTWVYIQVNGRFRNHFKTNYRHNQYRIDPEILDDVVDHHHSWKGVEEGLELDLSDAAMLVVHLITDGSPDLGDLSKTPKSARKKLKRYLQDHLGWSLSQICETFWEIEHLWRM